MSLPQLLLQISSLDPVFPRAAEGLAECCSTAYPIPDHAKEAALLGEAYDWFCLETDENSPEAIRLLAFFGPAQIFGLDCGTEDENGFICSQAPNWVYDSYADEDGRFKVTVDLYLKEEKEDEDREEWDNIMSSGEWSFLFNDMVVANQFFEEHIGSVCGGFDQDRDPIRKEYVEYGLTPDPDDEDNDDDTIDKDAGADIEAETKNV